MGSDFKYKIKKGKVRSFERMVVKNTRDSYSFTALKCALLSFEVLDDGGTCEEAEAIWKGQGLTGFLAGCTANIIATFNVRGDEFRQHWNKKWGVSEEKAKGGTVNPALWSVG